MIVWVNKDATKRPNDQRAEILTVRGNDVYVIMCGDGIPYKVEPKDICGLALADGLDILFRVHGHTKSSTG